MARQSRQIIEKAYRAIYYPGKKDVALAKKDDKIINDCLDAVRRYQGRFPYEEKLTDEEIMNKREMNSDAASGDATGLVRYFKGLGMKPLGIWNSDWELIFALYKDFVDNRTALSDVEARKKWYADGEAPKVEKSGPDDAFQKHMNLPVDEEPDEAPTVAPKKEEPEPVKEKKEKPKLAPKQEEQKPKPAPQATPVSMADDEDDVASLMGASHKAPNNINLSQEETKMAQPTINDMMGQSSAAVQEAHSMAAEFGGKASMNLSGATNLAASGVLSDEEKALAKEVAAEQMAARRAWNDTHKIAYCVLGNYPLKDRIKNGVTKGKIKNPDSQLTKILDKVWEGEQRPEGMDPNGLVNGEVAIPKSVNDLSDAENYKTVIKALIEAKNGGDDMLAVNLNGKLGSFKGVVVNTSEGTESWTMREAKEAINQKGSAKLQFEGLVGKTQLQIKIITSEQIVKQKSKRGSNFTMNDMTQMVFAGRDIIVDMKSGVIKDPARVKVYNEINDDPSKVAVDDKYPATSEIGFKYMKAADAKDPKSKPKKMTKRISLAVELKASIPSTVPEMQKFSPKASVGQAATPYSSKDEEAEIEKLWVASFDNLSTTGDTAVDEKRAQLKAGQSAANAAEAAAAMGGNM